MNSIKDKYCNDIINNIVDKIYNKKILSNRKTWIDLTLYTLLVYNGIRESYLIDCCCINSIQTELIISSILNYKYDKKDLIHIVIMTIKEDILIIREDKLLLKIDFIRNNDLSNHPFIIDINETIPILQNNDMNNLTELLYKVINHIPSLIEENNKSFTKKNKKNKSIKRSTLFIIDMIPINKDPINIDIYKAINELGLTFIAGWLLGYPCIYLIKSHLLLPSNDIDNIQDESNKTCDNALSMQLLIKYEIKGKIFQNNDKINNNKFEEKNIIIKNLVNKSFDYIDLLEFSIPRIIVDNNKLINDIFTNIINDKIKIMETIIKNENNYLLEEIIMHNIEFMLPSIML
jgi:hypothetical protein